ncbi:hypothetical protein [Achromobacter ruhlandii]|uniref:hypothetical protein n=1 Tax=Achromobacter ruhlandii TaxID=72557 RepID=UPI0007BF3DDE|nr:hypothetical protein [Achromobacter ruhlandii]
MTNHNNAAQPVLTDDQIEVLAKKHIAPHADRLDATLPNRIPYQQTEQFRRVKALIGDVLSKLRAPVADERAAFEKWTGYTEDALSRDAGDGYCIKGVDNQWCAWQARATLASAPVAGEAQVQQRVAYTDSCGHLHWTNGRRILVSLYAAPQASAEAQPNQRVYYHPAQHRRDTAIMERAQDMYSHLPSGRTPFGDK